jgi:tRNA threonylcarbamoyladenosine biosynthesis protein TsaB
MIILTLRTDKPEAEIGLFEDTNQLDYVAWQAHRELSDTLHTKLEEMLKSASKTWQDVEGVVVYKGPGSFTGLRIGMSVANTLASTQNIPIISEAGEDWKEKGLNALLTGKNEQLATPDYGAPVKTTLPRK